MSDLMNELKEKNMKAMNQLVHKFYYIVFSLIFIGVLFLFINPEQLISVGVLFIFFGFVLLIITLFLSALNAAKNKKTQIKNSVDLVYQNYLGHINHLQGTDLQFVSSIEDEPTWYLVPSFVQKMMNYAMIDPNKKSAMYHGVAFKIFGSKQTRTYYFDGMYYIFNDVNLFDGEMEYRDHKQTHQKIINKLTPLVHEDLYNASRYQYKTDVESGYFYSQKDRGMPQEMIKLLELIKGKSYVSNVMVGIFDQQLHIAVEETNKRLPYIKSYKDEELEQIEKIVDENATLFIEISNLIYD